MKIKLTIIGLLHVCQCCAQQHWQAMGLGLQNPNSTTSMYNDTVNNLLYIAGQFGEVNGNNQRGIAAWDGVSWYSLGDGIDSCSTCGTLTNGTWDMARFGSYLYIAGGFDWVGEIGAKNLARWDGVNWDTIPGGQPNGSVGDIEVFNNELYICGWFDSVGNVPTCGIARWDGSSWQDVGNYDFAASGDLAEMEFYHGNLYVGGLFDDPQSNSCRLAKWDGSSWQFMTNDLTGSIVDVRDFIVYDDELYVSGLFYQAAGNAGNSIMRWNDTIWRDVGGSAGFYSHNVPQVRQMYVHNGKLFCAGNFEIIGGIFAFGLASWDGTNWCGYNTSFTVNSQECGTINLAFYQDTLYVGGGFFIVDGDSMNGIAKWIGGGYVDTCGNTTGISEQSNLITLLHVYPNPSSSIITFQFLDNSTHEIMVSDQLGREIWRKESSESTVEFPANDFSAGMYFYRIEESGTIKATGKLMVE